MKYSISRLDDLKNAIESERQQEVEYINDLVATKSISQLIQNSICLYPLDIVDKGYTIGDYPYITVDIVKPIQINNAFKSGDIVNVFSPIDGNLTTHTVRATINYKNKSKIRLVFDTNEIDNWVYHYNIGIYQQSDEKSLNEMINALDTFISSQNDHISELRDKIYNGAKLFIPIIKHHIKDTTLNESQNICMNAILEFKDILTIIGPPGTGKTTTLVRSVYHLCKKENKVLVTAPSNSAVDLLTKRLAAQGLKVLRLGNLSRMDDDVIQNTLEYKVQNSSEYRDIKKLRIKKEELYKLASKFKRNFSQEDRVNRKLMYQEARAISEHIRMLEDLITDSIISNTQVFLTTLIGTTNKVIQKVKFDTVIIDEASQALEPACYVAMLNAPKVVLCGDNNQLPPTVKSNKAQKLGLSTTLMDIVCENNKNVYLLDTQYRMNEVIMGFSNKYFYNGKLQAHKSVKDGIMKSKGVKYNPILFIDTAGTGYNEEINTETLSYRNMGELELIFNNIKTLVIDLKYDNDNFDIGVVSQYKYQVETFKQEEESTYRLKDDYDITYQTIDSFQGQERDIIYISLVRSNNNGEIGFLKDYRRINVALTRAKKMLIVVGDSGTISSDDFYSQMLDYFQDNNGYKSAFEFMEY